MPNKFNVGNTAFLVVSNQVIREVKILKCYGDFYTIRFVKGGGGLRLRESRLFATREDAEASLSKPKSGQSVYYRSPWE